MKGLRIGTSYWRYPSFTTTICGFGRVYFEESGGRFLFEDPPVWDDLGGLGRLKYCPNVPNENLSKDPHHRICTVSPLVSGYRKLFAVLHLCIRRFQTVEPNAAGTREVCWHHVESTESGGKSTESYYCTDTHLYTSKISCPKSDLMIRLFIL